MVLLVTAVLTIPVGFAFYQPDPGLKAWEKEEQRLKPTFRAKSDLISEFKISVLCNWTVPSSRIPWVAKVFTNGSNFR
jgi:hypothetical protein